MMKLVNTVLCLACIAGIAGIIHTYNNQVEAAENEPQATGFFGGGSTWRTVSATPESRIPPNPFVSRSSDSLAAGDLTPAERAAGIERWEQLRELAYQTPVQQPKTNRRKDKRRQQELLAAKQAKATAYDRARKLKSRADRRSRTLFEQSRHYKRYKSTYENRSDRRRGGLPADRRPRSRYR